MWVAFDDLAGVAVDSDENNAECEVCVFDVLKVAGVQEGKLVRNPKIVWPSVGSLVFRAEGSLLDVAVDVDPQRTMTDVGACCGSSSGGSHPSRKIREGLVEGWWVVCIHYMNKATCAGYFEAQNETSVAKLCAILTKWWPSMHNVRVPFLAVLCDGSLCWSGSVISLTRGRVGSTELDQVRR